MVHDPQFLFIPSLSFFPLSLFSLFSVQHPGIKILRSDSSSSISSRIGWISPLSLTLSLSCLYFLRLVWFWLFFCVPLGFHFSFFSSSSFFFCCSYLYRSPLFLLLPWFGGLALLLCLADCDHLTNIMSPHCSSPTVAAGSSPEILICSLFPTPFRGLRHSSGPREFSCVCVCVCLGLVCI